jgi:uncharacterized protein (TIGR00255 family)
MIKSMTGFGRSELVLDGITLTVELRSVNHRYQEIFLRLPRELYPLEDEIKKRIQEQIKRGRVDGTIMIDQSEVTGSNVQIDWQKAHSYYYAAEEIKAKFQLNDPIRLDFLLNLPDLFITKQNINLENYYEEILAVVSDACHSLVQMRVHEGLEIHKNLLERISVVEQLTEEIRLQAPLVVEQYRTRLMHRIDEFLSGRNDLDEARILNEVAIFADKANIDEELSRLDSHTKQFLHILGADEPVGRRLDFLIQEMNREVNTIGSKANNIKIAQSVVDLKSEIEKLREQVQNIE